MPRQTAIRNVNRMILEDREEGRSRSDRSASLRAFLEEAEREEQEERERRERERQQRLNAQFQAEHNREISDYIKSTSPMAREDLAQQTRIDASRGIEYSDTGTKFRGSGRSFDTKLDIPSVSGTGATTGKKRAEKSIYQNYLDQADNVQQIAGASQPAKNRQAQRRSYTTDGIERTKNDRTYGLDTTLPEGRYTRSRFPKLPKEASQISTTTPLP